MRERARETSIRKGRGEGGRKGAEENKEDKNRGDVRIDVLGTEGEREGGHG